MLLKYFPRFLEFDMRWINALVEAEWDMMDNYK